LGGERGRAVRPAPVKTGCGRKRQTSQSGEESALMNELSFLETEPSFPPACLSQAPGLFHTALEQWQ